MLLCAVSATAASAAPTPAPPGATQTTTTVTSTATETVPGYNQGTLTSSLTVAGAGHYLSDAQVFTKLFHTFPKDLKVTLTSPAGTTIQLADAQGGGSDDVYSATRWSDAAGVPVARTTFTNKVAKAALTPQQAFGRFLGEDPNGVWQLKVTDQFPDDDTGILKGWSLDVTTLPEAPTLTTHHEASTGTFQDIGATPVTSTITVGNLPRGSVWKLRVTAKISSLARGGTNVKLTGPSGRTIQLVDDNFPVAGPTQSQLPYYGTVFDDTSSTLATSAIASGDTAMPSLAPVEALGAFRGEAAAGNWKLTVSDAKASGGDNLEGWSIDLVSAATIGPPTAPHLCVPTTSTQTVTTGGTLGTPVPINYHNFDETTNGWTSVALDAGGGDVGTYLHSVQVVTRVSAPASNRLRMQLVAPDGQTVWLTRDYGATSGFVGESGATFDGTLFADSAGKVNPPGSVAEVSMPTDDTVSPVVPLEPLSRLVGINPKGVWHLRAFDSRDAILSGSDRAYLKGFSLKLTTLNEAPVRQKTVAESGPESTTAGAFVMSVPLAMQDAGTVLDQLEVGLDAPELGPDTLLILTSPQGSQVTLNSGALNATALQAPYIKLFSDMTFSDTASSSIIGTLSTAKGADSPQFPISSGAIRYEPLQALGAFRGENPNGTWRLLVITTNSDPVSVDNVTLTARTGACSDTTPPTNPTLTSPTHTVGVRSTDNTVTVDLAGAADADSGVAGYSYKFSGSPAGDPGTTVNLDASATSVTSAPLGDDANPGWYLNLRTVDGKGNWSDPVHLGPFFIDTLVPETVIQSGPTAATGNARPIFTFSSTRGGALYDCATDLEAFAPCTSPYQPATALSPGAHVFKVRAKDQYGLGLVDTTPDTHSFTVDTTVPDTTITSGPTGIIASTTPSWAFTSTKAGSTFTCQIDSAPAVACTSPFAPGALSNGNHTFKVFATDSGGADDPTPATRSITVDAIAPDTSFTSGPVDGASINSATPSFGLASDESPVTFECKVDTSVYVACASPFAPGTLGTGSHTVSVRAIDAAGNVATPASRTFTVDTTAPVASFVGNPTGTISNTQPVMTLASTEAGSTFECAVDVGTFAPCTSPWTPTLSGEGSHILSVRAIDAAGNHSPSAMRTLILDTIAPDTTLGASPAGTTGASPTFTFNSPDGGVTFECAVDSGAYAACTTPKAIGPLSSGTHRFDVRAIDAAGNADPTPAGRQFTVDTTAPVPSFTGALVVTNATSRAQASFTSDDSLATYECAVDSGVFAGCSSPWTTPAQADGTHTVKVRATDASGNVSAPITSSSFTIDTVVPNTTIDSGPTGTVATASASLTFSSNEAGVTFDCNLDNEAFYTTCTSPRSLSALAEGAHTFRVRARDAAGNVDATPATRIWTVDTIAPDTTIDSGPTGTSGATATFAFSSDAGSTFACSFDGAPATTCTSPKAYTGLASGAHAFTVTATDAAGNVDATPATRAFTTDLTTPVVTITAGPAAGRPTNVDRPTFAFVSSKPGSTFLCALDSDPFTPCASGDPVSKLDVGDRTFWVKAVDALGNVSARLAQRSFTVDLVAPVTSTIAAPLLTSVTGAFSGVAGSSEAGSFECNVDDGDWAACDASWVTPQLANDIHRLGVRAVDVAGNRDATPIFFDVTVAVPAPPVITTPTTPTTTTPTTTTVTTPTTPIVADDNAITLVSPAAKKPSLQLKGKPLTLSRTAVRFSLRCPAGVTKCKAAVKLSALGTAKTRGLTFSSYKGTLKPNATTVLESALSAKSKRAIKSLKSARVRVSVTMSSASGKAVTRRWDLTIPITTR